MQNLISRQAAIDAIRHIEEIYVNNLPTMIDKASAQTELMLLPSAQPEIITCENCKHGDAKPISDGRRWCDRYNAYLYYCSDAEVREDEETDIS